MFTGTMAFRKALIFRVILLVCAGISCVLTDNPEKEERTQLDTKYANKMVARESDTYKHNSFSSDDIESNDEELEMKKRGDTNVPMCANAFRQFPGHTMCLADDPDVNAVGVPENEKLAIVQQHNHIRARVIPPATDMQKMIWDERLAEVAQKWTSVCVIGHDKERRIPGFGASVGQNLASATGPWSWTGAISYWAEEVNNYKYGLDPEMYLPNISEKMNMIGHYTQLVLAGASRIGCGYSECPSLLYKYRYACNYALGQTYRDVITPYTEGERCHDCLNRCDNGLCDCGGRICENHAMSNVSECSCNCIGLFRGDTCSTVDCDLPDKLHFCSQVIKEHCVKYYNVPAECPHLCELCEGMRQTTVPTTEVTTTPVTPFPEITTEHPPMTPRMTSPKPSTGGLCTPEYEAIPGHVFCSTNSSAFLNGGLSKKDRKFILSQHNRIRARVKPSSRDMRKLVWDDLLAAQAQKWSEQCQPSRDPNRRLPGYDGVIGQNKRAGSRSWKRVIQKWKDESRDYQKLKGNPSVADNEVLMSKAVRDTRDYIQIIMADTVRIGCGFSRCEHDRKLFYFCNYFPGISEFTNPLYPYGVGNPCSECPNHCSDGLCDCGRTVCPENGWMNLETCVCMCYVRETADIIPCVQTSTEQYNNVSQTTYSPTEDTHPSGTVIPAEGLIELGTTLPTAIISGCWGKKCLNDGELNMFSCQCLCFKPFYGDDCSSLKCPSADERFCRMYKPSQCEKTPEIVGSCPYLCGLCVPS